MALLSEYALTPDVFDSTSYSNDEVCGIRLQDLKEVLLSEGLVRDLRNGDWSILFRDTDRPWHIRGKELLKKLILQKRLRPIVPALGKTPLSDIDWCEEALASHSQTPLKGVITTQDIAINYQSEPLIECINKLTSAPWWAGRSPSVRLSRTINDYKKHLYLLLNCANSIMFIDPHLDPRLDRYKEFINLIIEMSGRTPAPSIEIHRVCYFDTRDKRDQYNENGWKSIFGSWISDIQKHNLSVNVFIWDDFHDRYVISNLVGIQVPNGFDTTADISQLTTWTRLGRDVRDDIGSEFEENAYRHNLRHHFSLP